MTQRPEPVSATRAILVDAPLPRAFEAAVTIDPVRLMRPRGLLPGVAGADGVAAWTRTQDERFLVLTDGSTVTESLIDLYPDDHFAYRVSDFTGPFGALVAEARSDWRFLEDGADRTKIEWTYAFTPKSGLVRGLLGLIIRGLWGGHMQAGLERLKDDIETPGDGR